MHSWSFCSFCIPASSKKAVEFLGFNSIASSSNLFASILFCCRLDLSDWKQSLFDFADNENNLAIRLCGKIEQEIADLNKEEKSLFLDEYNLQEPGLNKLIHAGFNLLGLETYFTGGPTEVRAWTINKGSTAPQAAGEIHTDFERGFIKAEVIKYKHLIKYGSEKKVKDAGLSQLHGKEYIVEDGDCIYFHFNV